MLCLLMAGGRFAAADVYRWNGRDGQTYYSTAPPPYSVTNLQVKRRNGWEPYAAETAQSSPASAVRKAVVPYSNTHAVVTIPVTINHALESSFVVDTGASYTIIPQAVADALGLRPDPDLAPLTLHTANGEIHAPLLMIDSLTIGSLTTSNVLAALYDMPGQAAPQALLGLNVLNRFTLTLDAARQLMTLTLVEPPISTTPGSLRHDCLTGRTFLQQGMQLHDGSKEEAWLYQQAIEACPNLVAAYYQLGRLYYQQRAYAGAIQVYQRLLTITPEAPDAYYRLGVLYLLNRNLELAEEAFLLTLRYAPSHAQARAYLRQLHGEQAGE